MSNRRARVPFDPKRIVGERYGRLVVLRHIRDDYQPRSDGNQQVVRLVECRCDCGKIITVPYANLRHGNTQSCGCLKTDALVSNNKHHAFYDPDKVAGEVYGRVTVIRHDHNETVARKRDDGKTKTSTRHYVVVRCTCGKEFVAPYDLLRAGKIMSCGCLKRELLVKRNATHGLLTDEIAAALYYNVYTQMIRRCYNKSFDAYKYYGGRGITICPEWYTPGVPNNPGFVAFYQWAMATGYDRLPDSKGVNTMSIDRIDDDGPYAPWNCRWATRKMQANNKSNNVIMHDVTGEEITRGNFATKYNMDPHDLRSMMGANGWSEAAVLFKATNPEFGLRKATYRGQPTKYIDSDGRLVLIPSVEIQQIMYQRRTSNAKQS